MWYQLPPWWRSCPQLVNCWNSFVCTFTSYFLLQILTVKSTIDDMLARSFKIWGANTCCSIITWWTFIKEFILHIQCDSVLDGGYWLLKRLVYNFYFPFTRRLSWHLGRLHLLDFLRVREKKTSVGFLNVQKPFNFLWIIIVSDYFLSYSLHHDVIKELIAYSYGSFT